MQTRRLAVKALQATGLNALAHHLYYTHFHGFNTSNKDVLPALESCFNQALTFGTVPSGDYLEFGLFKGYSFWYAQSVADRLGLTSMRFFGFDSFCGLPEIGPVDQTKNRDFYKGQYACSRDDVVRNLNSKGIDWKRTFLIEGYYADSLNPAVKTRHGLKQAAIILVDCDLYESTTQVLSFVEDLLSDETILMFDDWNCFDCDDNRGQRRAVREFLQCHPWWYLENLFAYGIYGHTFVARRRLPV
jgi:O-methyltransferase